MSEVSVVKGDIITYRSDRNVQRSRSALGSCGCPRNVSETDLEDDVVGIPIAKSQISAVITGEEDLICVCKPDRRFVSERVARIDDYRADGRRLSENFGGEMRMKCLEERKSGVGGIEEFVD